MPMFYPRTHESRFNISELDPCLAAEARIQDDLLDIRQSKCVLCIILTFLTAMLLTAACIMVFYSGALSSINQENRIKAIGSPDYTHDDPGVYLNNKINVESVETSTINTTRIIYNWHSSIEDAQITPKRPVVKTIATFNISIDEVQPERNRIKQETYSVKINNDSYVLPMNEESKNVSVSSITVAPIILPTTQDFTSIKKELDKKTIEANNRFLLTARNKNLVQQQQQPQQQQQQQEHSNRDLIEPTMESALRAFSTVVSVSPISSGKQNCEQYRLAGYNESGVYEFSLPSIGNFSAFCQMDNDSAWMVLQRRTGPNLPFWNATFEEYANGFGELNSDHWLGLEKLSAQFRDNYKLQLRIILLGDLCPETNKRCSGLGDNGLWWGDWDFLMANKLDFYRLTYLKFMQGNLSNMNSADFFENISKDQLFTTVDKDNDLSESKNGAVFREKGLYLLGQFHSYAVLISSGWWHRDHTFVSLNGAYASNKTGFGQSWYWSDAKGQSYNIKPKNSLMMFRIKK